MWDLKWSLRDVISLCLKVLVSAQSLLLEEGIRASVTCRIHIYWIRAEQDDGREEINHWETYE